MLKRTSSKTKRDPIMQERQLIEDAKKDPSKFEALYLLYYEPIYRFVYQRVNDQDNAKDVVSQVFLKAMTHIQKYEYRGFPFSSWLYRIAMNETIELFKKQKAERAINVRTDGLAEMINEMSGENRQEQQDQLIQVLRLLPEEDLQLIEMRFFEQRRFAVIGEILNITENNAKVKVYRILERMKKMVKEL